MFYCIFFFQSKTKEILETMLQVFDLVCLFNGSFDAKFIIVEQM